MAKTIIFVLNMNHSGKWLVKPALIIFTLILSFSAVSAQSNKSAIVKEIIVNNSPDNILADLPAPILVSPANDTTNQSIAPAFTWSAVTGATSYRIMIATVASDLPSDPTIGTGGSSVIINETPSANSYTPSVPLNPGARYYWEVHARNSAQYGTWSAKYSFTTTTAVNNSVLGIDVSHWDGDIQWANIASAGIQFSYIKATESTYSPDSKFAVNKQAAVAQNIAVGAYHFASPLFSPSYYKPGYDHQNTVADEVANFLNTAKSAVGKGFLPPALDVETQVVTWVAGGSNITADPLEIMGADSLAQWIKNWAALVFQQTNVMPVIYCDQSYAAQLYPYLKGSVKLWIADWDHPAGYPNTANWQNWPWAFQQWSDLGILGGLTGVDEDIFNGTMSDFTDLLTSVPELDRPNASPSSFTLSQNYPNPFNPVTAINYSLPKEGNIKITVYNSIGSRVAVLVDGYKPAGSYSVQLNGRNLASGMYIYRMESGNFSLSKKCILLK